MSEGLGLLIGGVLLLFNAFFVGAEFALITARRSQIELVAETGSRRAKTTLRAMENITLMMAGAQLGITICSLGIGRVAEPAIGSLIEPIFEAVGIGEDLLHPIAFVIALFIASALHMVLGEMIPKNIALAGSERTALRLGPPLALFVAALRPVLVLLNGVANRAVRAIGVEPRDEVASAFSRDDIAEMVAESRTHGLLSEDDYELLMRALSLHQHTAESVLVPMAQLVTLTPSATPREIENASARTGFSRFALADGSGELVGYVHLKDALARAEDKRDEPFASGRTLPDVRYDDSLSTVLNTLRAAGAHLGRVRRDGRTIGLVALEDVLERLVGDVRDATRRV